VSFCNEKIALTPFLVLAMTLGACERERRQYELPAAQASQLKPAHASNERNAYAMSQGKNLFRWYNCTGCHANGGGGMGPALMDDKWRYGNNPEDIYASIMDGRPNGMPAFRGKINEDQVWQLVAYVRSMSGWARKDAAPSRNDSLYPGEPESVRDQRN
jgi:cytochrome c oxidase cbb3-type subunit III